MVMVTLLSSGLILAPLLINEILRTRMNESIQQAILLAQKSHKRITVEARADSHGTHFKVTIPHDAQNAPRDQVLEARPSLDAPAMEV